MKRIIMRFSATVIISCLLIMGGIVISAGADPSGEALFKQHCAICHPDGGNIVTPQKTLHKKVRESNKVKTEADIVKLMRNPGPGMTPFDKKTVSDSDAKKIAEFILTKFK